MATGMRIDAPAGAPDGSERVPRWWRPGVPAVEAVEGPAVGLEAESSNPGVAAPEATCLVERVAGDEGAPAGGHP